MRAPLLPRAVLAEVFAALKVRAIERTLSDPTLPLDPRAVLSIRLCDARNALAHARRVNDKIAFGAAS